MALHGEARPASSLQHGGYRGGPMKHWTTGCVMLALMAAAPSNERLTGVARITGTVRDSGGQPIADVRVRWSADSTEVRTNSRGRFTLDGITAGSHVLSVRAIGYTTSELPI